MISSNQLNGSYYIFLKQKRIFLVLSHNISMVGLLISITLKLYFKFKICVVSFIKKKLKIKNKSKSKIKKINQWKPDQRLTGTCTQYFVQIFQVFPGSSHLKSRVMEVKLQFVKFKESFTLSIISQIVKVKWKPVKMV